MQSSSTPESARKNSPSTALRSSGRPSPSISLSEIQLKSKVVTRDGEDIKASFMTPDDVRNGAKIPKPK